MSGRNTSSLLCVWLNVAVRQISLYFSYFPLGVIEYLIFAVQSKKVLIKDFPVEASVGVCGLNFQSMNQVISNTILTEARTLPGLPRHRETREFGSPFFQTGKTQGICQKILKICFSQGI